MALDFASMLLQPTKTSPWDLSPGGGSMARENLRLARERFEWEKAQADKEAEYKRQSLAAEAAKQAALREKERLDREATAQAALLKQQQDARAKFSELAGSGKVEQAQAMVPYLDSLGIGVKDLGGIGGLSVFELNDRAQEAAAASAEQSQQPLGANETAEQSLGRMGTMGLDTANARGTLEQPAGIGSTEDAFARAQAASQYSELTGKPAAPPDEEDYTGAVPRNVIDLPAQQAATLARLRPMLGAVQESYPKDYRGSAEKTAEAVSKSGLPAVESLALFKELRQSPDELIKAELNANAQKDKFRETRDELTPVQAEQLKGEGFSRANTSYKNSGIADFVTSIKAADTVDDLLKSGPRNHGKVVNYLMQMTGNKGPQTEQDALRTIGGGQISSIDQLFDWLHKQAGEGFSPELQQSIKDFVQIERGRSESGVYDWLDSMGGQMENPKTHERVRAGYEEFRDSGAIPQGLLRQYQEDREKERKQKGSSAAAPAGKGAQFDPNPVSGDFDIELEGQALESDLDPDKVKAIIGPESGGKANAKNAASGATGLIQFLPSIAKKLGTSVEELAKMSPTEQLPFVMKYLSGTGINSDSPPEDYAMAVAAPAFIGKPANTPVYKKGSIEWEQNPAWRPADGGDITVGSIQAYYAGGGKAAAKAAAPKVELPEPTTAAEKRLRELMDRERR